jgi:O-antigen/teichoic acid export membrane protein
MTQVNRRLAAMATLIGNGATVSITVLQAFLLIPLSLATIGPHLYSSWLAASEVLIWMQMLDGGLPNLLMQRVGALVGRQDWHAAARWSSTTFLWLLVIGVLLLAAAVGLAPRVVDWLSVTASSQATFVACFRTAALASVLLMLSNGAVALSRGVQDTGLVSALQVAGAAAGLCVSLGLLIAGWGLWALAFGMLVRALLSATGAVCLLARLARRGHSWWASPSIVVSREILGLVPSMSVGNVAYALGNNSEVLLVTSVLGPGPALTYALTRRAFDGVRSLLDTVAWAVSGGFAHLVTAVDRHRAQSVLREILWLRIGIAALGLGTVVAVNESFVSLLFGASHFGGFWLTVAFALQMMLTGQSFLVNYLWRATGHVREGSLMLGAEAVARVILMAISLYVLGSVGAPLAAALVSLFALVLVHRRLRATLPAAPSEPDTAPAPWAPVLISAGAVLVALLPMPMTWTATAAVTTAMAIGGGGLLWIGQPAHARARIAGLLNLRSR